MPEVEAIIFERDESGRDRYVDASDHAEHILNLQEQSFLSRKWNRTLPSTSTMPASHFQAISFQ